MTRLTRSRPALHDLATLPVQGGDFIATGQSEKNLPFRREHQPARLDADRDDADRFDCSALYIKQRERARPEIADSGMSSVRRTGNRHRFSTARQLGQYLRSEEHT